MAKNPELERKIEKRNSLARQAEEREDSKEAIKLYEENLREKYPDEMSFERLMILYRKSKQFKDELRVINLGIKIFKVQHENQAKELLADKKNKRKVHELSEAFMKSSGLKDRKGNMVFHPEPIAKWMKRKEVVEKKIK